MATTATCLDLWPLSDNEPRVFDAEVNEANQPTLVFWISGADSAGSTVRLGGGPQEDGSVLPIFSGQAQHKSEYIFIEEKATFEIQDVLLSEDPRVGESMKLRIKVKNTGSMAGVAELVIKSVTDSGTPVVEDTVTVPELGIQEVSDWVDVTLAPFASQTTGMYYTISLNGSSESIYDGSQGQWADVFNVKVKRKKTVPTCCSSLSSWLPSSVFSGPSFSCSLAEAAAHRCSMRSTRKKTTTKATVRPRYLPRFLQMSIPKWREPCNSSPSGAKRRFKATLTKAGPLNRFRIGSTTSEATACPRCGPMRSGRTLMAGR